MKHRILTIAAVAVFAIMALPAAAQGWARTRDSAMELRERGNSQAAYSLVARYSPATPQETFDAEFVSGWLALRFLNRPDVALTHFTRMAASAPSLRSYVRNGGKAQAGYWLGRTLRVQGRADDAKTLFAAAAGYPNTFYGQMSAAELKIGLSKERIAGVATSYPVRDFKWHDGRAQREFILAVIKEESDFKQSEASNKGARGLMQVMPDTARHVGKTAGVNIDLGLVNSNPDYNVAVGSKYLADQIDRYRGNMMLAAAAYNAGPGKVDEWLGRFGDPRGGVTDPIDWIESIPYGETRDYVKKVIGSYITYLALAPK